MAPCRAGRDPPRACTVKPEMSPCLQAVTHCSKLIGCTFSYMSSSLKTRSSFSIILANLHPCVRLPHHSLARHGLPFAARLACEEHTHAVTARPKNTRMPSPQGHLLTPRQQLWDSIERGAALAECEALLKADTGLLNSPSEVCSLHLFSHTALDTPLLL